MECAVINAPLFVVAIELPRNGTDEDMPAVAQYVS